MKIAVFGATGRTGLLLLEQGMQRGHAMTAFTRRPHLLDDVHGLREIITGDGRKHDAVVEAVRDQDAVISILSNAGLGPSTEVTDVTRTIVTAMQETDSRRLICVSAHPLVATRPRLIVGVVKWLLRNPYADLATMERLVATSPLEWSLVRPTQLLDGPATGHVQIIQNQNDFPTGPYHVRRADLAAVLLNVAEQEAFAKSALEVTGARKP